MIIGGEGDDDESERKKKIRMRDSMELVDIEVRVEAMNQPHLLL